MKGERWDLKERTKSFAPRVIKMYCALPKTTEAQVLGKQALRSGTSVGAHYREAKRARSDAEFISKIEAHFRNLKKRDIGLDCLLNQILFPKRDYLNSYLRRKNCWQY